MRQFMDMDRKIHEELDRMNRNVALFALGHLIADLKEKYKDNPDVTAFLDSVQSDVLDNLAQFGALITDFTMIRGGSLHRANNGYLILPVEELLRNPFSYEGLKRALKSEHIKIEEAEERFGYITSKSLRPEPIPLDIKVVLIGNPYLYEQLYILDMEFSQLFKVKADFDTSMKRTEEKIERDAAFVCTLCVKENLKHLDGSRLAKLVEHSSRLAEDQEKLSTRFAEIADIIREANFYATQEKSNLVTGDHVKKAIEEKIYRE